MTWVAISFVVQLTIQLQLIDGVSCAFKLKLSLERVSETRPSHPYCSCIAATSYVMLASKMSMLPRDACSKRLEE